MNDIDSDSESDSDSEYHYPSSDSSDSDSDDEDSTSNTVASQAKKAFLNRQSQKETKRPRFRQHVASAPLVPKEVNKTLPKERIQAIERRMIKTWFKDSSNIGRWRIAFRTIEEAEQRLIYDFTIQRQQDVEYLKSMLKDRCNAEIKLERQRRIQQERQSAKKEYERLKKKNDMKSIGRSRYLKRKYPDLKLLRRYLQF